VLPWRCLKESIIIVVGTNVLNEEYSRRVIFPCVSDEISMCFSGII
jgi:hypothetical protein